MKAKKINARSKELENAMKKLYRIKDGGVPPELAIQEAKTLIETIEHQEAEINYLHDIMIKRGEQMVYEEMYNDMKKLADKQEKEIEELKEVKWYYEISRVSKDKIKAKIKRYNDWIKEGGDYVESLEAQRYALQELLEEEKE